MGIPMRVCSATRDRYFSVELISGCMFLQTMVKHFFAVTRNADVDTLGTLSETTPISQAKPESTPTPTTTPTPSPKEDQNEDKTEISFVLNTNTKKFHLPHCASLKRMSEKNRKETGLTRDEIISQGYSPCGNCKP